MFGPTWGDCVVGDVATLSCIGPLFQNIIMAAVMLSGAFAVFLLLYAGFKFIRSNGDPKQVDGARQIAVYAILGIFLIMLSFLIVRLVSQITNVDCLTKFGFSQCNQDEATSTEVKPVGCFFSINGFSSAQERYVCGPADTPITDLAGSSKTPINTFSTDAECTTKCNFTHSPGQ